VAAKSSPEDLEATRAKLLEAALQVFADCGFENATVREICARAGANVAAINYHFGDKLGLYTEVIKSSKANKDHAEIEAAMRVCKTPQEALRLFIRGTLARTIGKGSRSDAQIRLFMQELARPTPALASVVEYFIAPRYSQLRALVGTLIGRDPSDRITRFCAHSLIGQVTHYIHARPVIARVWPELQMSEEIDAIADHIVDFTLAGCKAIVKREKAGEAGKDDRTTDSRPKGKGRSKIRSS